MELKKSLEESIYDDFLSIISQFSLYEKSHGIIVRENDNQYDINYSTNGFKDWARNGKYATHAHLTLEGDIFYINSFSIDSENVGFRKGYGGEMLHIFEEFAKLRKCSEIRVFPSGIYMISFFDKRPEYIEQDDGERIKKII